MLTSSSFHDLANSVNEWVDSFLGDLSDKAMV